MSRRPRERAERRCRRSRPHERPPAHAVATVLLGAIVALAPRAGAEGTGPSESEDPASRSRWRPWLSVSLQAQQQRAEGSISSSLATDVVGPSDSTPIALDADNHDDYFVPVVPIGIGVDTPPIELPRSGVRPRLAFGAAYEFIPITERDFLVDGKFVPLPADPTAASEGLGGEVRVDLQHQWSLSTELVLPFEVGGIPIELRPGVLYMGQWVRADAKAIGVQIGTDALVELEAEDSRAFHYLGPLLAIETEAGRAGSWHYSVFARAAVLFSDLGGRQRTRGLVSAAGESMRFGYEPDAALYRVGVGLRVRWDPRRP